MMDNEKVTPHVPDSQLQARVTHYTPESEEKSAVKQEQIDELWDAVNHTRAQIGQPELGPKAKV
jgi:hypothetical protein